jgi:hypothetical protein
MAPLQHEHTQTAGQHLRRKKERALADAGGVFLHRDTSLTRKIYVLIK